VELLETHLEKVVQAVLAAGVIWAVGPLLLFFAPFRRFRTTASGDEPDTALRAADPDVQKRLAEVRARGFHPAGRIVDHCWFFTPLHWHFAAPTEHHVASADGTVHIGANRLGDHPVRLAAHTVFEGGGMFTTSTAPAVAMGQLPDRFRRVQIGDHGPDDLLTEHDRNVRAFCEERGLRIKSPSLDDVATQMESHSAPFVRREAFAPLYSVPLLALVPFAYPLLTTHRASPTLLTALGFMSVALFASLRVRTLPEYRRRARELAGFVLMILGAIPGWQVVSSLMTHR
jgi:hypothetical protein